MAKKPGKFQIAFGYFILCFFLFSIIFTIWSRGDEKYEYMYAREFMARVDLSPIFTIGKNPFQKEDTWKSMNSLKEAFGQSRAQIEEIKDVNVAEELAIFQEEALNSTIQACHEKRGNLYCKYIKNEITKKINSTQNKDWLVAMTDLLEGEIKGLQLGQEFAVLFVAEGGTISEPSTERAYGNYMQQHEKNQKLLQKAEKLFPFYKVMQKYGEKEDKESTSWKETITRVLIVLAALFCVYLFIFICQVITVVFNKRKFSKAIREGDAEGAKDALKGINSAFSTFKDD